MRSTQEKYQALLELLRSLGSTAVAFSSGVDSTFLLKAAHDALGDNAIAITASAPWFPQREQAEAAAFCRSNGIKQVICTFEEDDIPGFQQNPKNRCYLCKQALFQQILDLAHANGMNAVAEGSNLDDDGDYRPGMIAVKELGIKSPLHEVGLTKADIRQLSKELCLPTWEKPSFACLASRFVYGETITREKLDMVERAEQLLLELGFRQVRVRIHGETLARIEVLPGDISRLLENRVKIETAFHAFGFTYVTLDLQGYRTGSMNETFYFTNQDR